MRKHHKEVVCVRCGNVDDIFGIQGEPYCAECRTCPHNIVVMEQPPCAKCLRDRHSVWTFSQGPRIVSMFNYMVEAAIFNCSIYTWNVREENFYHRIFDDLKFAAVRFEEKRKALTEPPYPLLHLMLQRITSRR